MSSGQAWQWIKSIETTIDQALDINDSDPNNNNTKKSSATNSPAPNKTPKTTTTADSPAAKLNVPSPSTATTTTTPTLSSVFSTVSSIVAAAQTKASTATTTTATNTTNTTTTTNDVDASTKTSGDDEDEDEDEEFLDIEDEEEEATATTVKSQENGEKSSEENGEELEEESDGGAISSAETKKRENGQKSDIAVESQQEKETKTKNDKNVKKHSKQVTKTESDDGESVKLHQSIDVRTNDKNWIRVRLLVGGGEDDKNDNDMKVDDKKKREEKVPNDVKKTTNSAELSLLQEQVKRQTTQLNNVFSELSTRDKQIQQLSLEVSQLKNENLKLHRLNEDVRMEAKEATDQFESLKNEFSERLAKEERKVAQLRREKQELKDKNATEMLNVQNLKVDTLTKEVDQLTKKVANLELVIRKLKQTNQDLETEKSNWNQMCESMKSEMISLKEKVLNRKDSGSSAGAVQWNESDDVAKRLRMVVSAVLNEWEQKTKTIFDANNSIKNLEGKLAQKTEEYNNLINDYQNLQETMVTNTDIAEKKQDALRREIETLLKRCNMADVKNEDMITSLPDMTTPLLEQIEQLEKSAVAKEEQWKEVEQRLNYKLKIAENNVKISQIEQQKLQNSIRQLNETIEEQRKHVEKLNRQLKESIDACDRTKQQLNEKLESTQPLQTENAKLKLDMDHLQKLYGKSREEIESLYQQIEKLKEQQKQMTPVNYTLSSVQGTTVESQQKQVDAALSINVQRPSPTNTTESTLSPHSPISPSSSSDDSLALATVQNLQAELRKQNAKTQSLIKRIEELEETKNRLSEEIIEYTKQNRKLLKRMVNQEQLQKELQELQTRHNAALELIGENEETIGDLQQDLKYVKEKFRVQVTSLLEEIDLLRKGNTS